ncbi:MULTISPECIES: hypothetical protein [Vibrio harveyi group]|uniref:Uncharacterized protein n=3 Tax=Vibrio harveyi group TaxID=717610 RepID=U3C9Y4_9VIBR|nr:MULTISPECIES: hypothetical protein [Vibrio harveyi group]PNQ69310.1 hypothetical protein C1141_06265 [Vibrio agarivorans]GAD78164.1 hypothetical protein VAZ01S_136_00040 [Vibrio azureus NBRC 104587]GAD78180.1 hypothetical protein VAZ01S_139_00040 [Vibrio azureus NBRC 104587]GEM77354.1 hypothetical protein VSA01S_34660 [Vibrio sagamiensis NBRC 104589]
MAFDANWIHALVAVASFLVLVSSILIGYLFRLAKELAEFKLYVATYHATKDEVEKLGEKIDNRLETHFNRIYDILNQRNIA